MVADELSFCSLSEISALIRRKEVSVQELVDQQLTRLKSLEPRLNAFITVTEEEARGAAKDADRKLARGEPAGPLHGVPMTLKDLLWTRGVPTTSGSKVSADFVPQEDATTVARLREAGAVFLGKTNLHEFAYGISNVNPHFGPVHNPWDEERISGGSSGGSAASLAAGIGYGSVGTDTGGSIRIPSSLCGTVGLKPTYGLVSRYGVTPLAWSLDHVGPMARSVRDVAILFDVLAGYDPKDPTSRKGKLASVSSGLDEIPSGLLMAIHPGYFFEDLDPRVRKLVDMARSVRDVAILFDVLAGYDPKDPTSRKGKPRSRISRSWGSSASKFRFRKSSTRALVEMLLPLQRRLRTMSRRFEGGPRITGRPRESCWRSACWCGPLSI